MKYFLITVFVFTFLDFGCTPSINSGEIVDKEFVATTGEF